MSEGRQTEIAVLSLHHSRIPILDTKANQRIFGSVNSAKLKNLREKLKSIRYTETTVSNRLRIWHISAIILPEYPVYRERLRQRCDALSIIISLFLLQSEVPRAAAESALTSGLVNELLMFGLLTQAPNNAVAATASIYPCSGLHFITDHHFRPGSNDYQIVPNQPVMHLGQDSYALAYLATKPPKGGRVLDMCAGSGVHAIQAAQQAERVIGVDINRRAVDFATVNAKLNGVSKKCDFRCGYLYDAVKSEGRGRELFDLILANPPFVPSPRTGPDRILFQDAGPAGDEILGPVLSGLLNHLTPRGSALIISLFADQKGSHHRAKIKKWIGSRTSVDLLLLKIYSVAPEELAFWFTWNVFGDGFGAYNERYKEWLDVLRAKEILKLTYGVLVVRFSHTSSFRTVDIPLSQALNKKRSSKIRRLMTQRGQSATG